LGLVAALQSHAERFLNGSGITYEITTNGLTNRLTPEIETALYRIYQEALNNVRRHSGARWVSITLNVHDGDLESEIRDDGHGFDPQAIDFNDDNPQGLGLLGIKERVNQLGGEVEIISKPGSGTLIRLRLPTSEFDVD
jgi:signal transduction histidine kinase